MKNRFKILSKGIWTILSSVLMLSVVSCSSADEPGGSLDSDQAGMDNCQLVISLKPTEILAKDPRSTRADETWDDPYDSDPGSVDEMKIDNLNLYIVTADNSVYPLEKTLLVQYPGSYRYKISLKTTSAAVTFENGGYYLNARIVAVANGAGLWNVDPSAFNPVTLLPYNISEIASKGLIPMWGVATLDNVELIPGQTVDRGTSIMMLRSVPKITISLADDISDEFVITAVSTSDTAFETTAYCQPKGAGTVSATSGLPIEGCFNPASGAKGGSPAFSGIGTTTASTYLAERSLQVNADGEPPYYNVTIARKNEDGSFSGHITGQLHLCDYADGEPDFSTAFPGLVRNHDYRYVIKLAPLGFLIDFKEWLPGGKVHIELE